MSFKADQGAMAGDNIALFGEACTYLKRTIGAFSSGTGTPAQSAPASSTVTMMKGRVTTRSGGKVEECVFTALSANLPGGADRDDNVTDADGLTWDVVELPRRCMGMVTDLLCKRTL